MNNFLKNLKIGDKVYTTGFSDEDITIYEVVRFTKNYVVCGYKQKLSGKIIEYKFNRKSGFLTGNNYSHSYLHEYTEETEKKIKCIKLKRWFKNFEPDINNDNYEFYYSIASSIIKFKNNK